MLDQDCRGRLVPAAAGVLPAAGDDNLEARPRPDAGRAAKQPTAAGWVYAEQLAYDTQLPRVPRTAVYLSAQPGVVPQALLHNLKHNLVLHERNIVLTVRFHPQPWIAPKNRLDITRWITGFGKSR